jgi:hypothetical protein
MSEATAQSAKFSKNSSIDERRFAFLTVTRFILMIAFIRRYFLDFFFFIKNHEFLYDSWHDSRIFRFIRFFSIFVTVLINALRIENSNVCQTSCFMILICWDDATFDLTFLIFENFHVNAISRLYSISMKRFFFWFVNSTLTIILSSRFSVSRESLLMLKNFDINQFLYDLFESLSNRASRVKISFFQLSFSSKIISSDWSEFTNQTLSTFLLYKISTLTVERARNIETTACLMNDRSNFLENLM